MTSTVLMPNASTSYSCPSGNVYLSDPNAFIFHANTVDLPYLGSIGGQTIFARNNATNSSPTVNDDYTKLYGLGSIWINTTTTVVYECGNPGSTPGTAVWTPIIGATSGYQGTWNASTNSPTIVSSAGNTGDWYWVGTAGTTTIDGISSWAVGDIIAFNGSVWQKIPVTFPIATLSTVGVVKPDGTTITVDISGVISALLATASDPGIVRPDSDTISIDGSGIIRAVVATAETVGVVKPDNMTLVLTSGVLSIPDSAIRPAAGYRGRFPLFFDNGGNAAIWYEPENELVNQVGGPRMEPLSARGGWAVPVKDRDGGIMGGWDSQNRFWPGPGDLPGLEARATTDGTTTISQVWLYDGSGAPTDGRRLTISEVDAIDPRNAGPGLVKYAGRDSSSRYASWGGTGENADDGKLRAIVSHGQSLDIGGVQAGVEAYITQPPSSLVKMWAQGIVPAGLTPNTMVEADFTTLVDAEEQVLSAAFGETGLLASAWALNGPRGKAQGSTYHVSAFGVGNKSYAELKKGTVPYDNMIAGTTALATQATGLGKSLSLDAFEWEQCENNLTDSEATYGGHLDELLTDVSTDFDTILGATWGGFMFMLQRGLFTTVSGELDGPCLAMFNKALGGTRFICAGPHYQSCDFGDLYHPTSQGHRLRRAYTAKAIRKVIYERTPFEPLHMESLELRGKIGVITWKVPVPPIRFDLTGWIQDDGHAGLVLKDDSGFTSTVGQWVTGPREITFELASAPGTNPSICCAWWAGGQSRQGRTLGPRSIICDSETEADPATGRMLHNYACHQQLFAP